MAIWQTVVVKQLLSCFGLMIPVTTVTSVMAHYLPRVQKMDTHSSITVFVLHRRVVKDDILVIMFMLHTFIISWWLKVVCISLSYCENEDR